MKCIHPIRNPFFLREAPARLVSLLAYSVLQHGQDQHSQRHGRQDGDGLARFRESNVGISEIQSTLKERANTNPAFIDEILRASLRVAGQICPRHSKSTPAVPEPLQSWKAVTSYLHSPG